MENFQNFFVLVLHVDEAELLTFVLANELRQLLTVLDLVQTLDELIREGLNPLDVLHLNFD